MPVPTLKPGQSLGGYEIIEFHGKGGMGEIFRARQLSIGREVALKILSPELARRDPQFAKSFVDEARAAGRLNHPNIIAVHDVGNIKAADRDEYLHYFSMEFVDGENLREVIDREGTCPMPLVESTMLGMAEALLYAESMAMIHRDIKPENIMVTRDGRIKLADFGLAQQIDPEANAADRDDKGRIRVMGTPRYMSPEQARGRPLDGRSDQYSLGATLFHLLTGAPPYRRDSGRATMKAHVSDPIPDPGELVRVTPAWRSLCMRLMAKSPDDRFATAQDLKTAVEQAVAGRTVRAQSLRSRTSDHSNDNASGSSSRILFMIAGAIVVIASITLVFSMGAGESVPPQPNPNPETTTNNPALSDPNHLSNDPALTEASGNSSLHVQRAEDLINNLPDDLSESIAQINTALANPYFQNAPQAKDLLATKLSELRTTLTLRDREMNRLRLSLQSELVRARSQAQSGQINAAFTILNALSPDDRAILGEDFARTRQTIVQQARDITNAIIEELNNAPGETQAAAILSKAQENGFPPQFMRRIEQAHEQRLVALQQIEEERKQALRAQEQQRVRSMIAILDGLRAGEQGPDIGQFITLANDYERRFESAESRNFCRQLAQIGELAQVTSNHFQHFVRTEKPLINVTAMGSVSQARLSEVEGNGAWLELIRGGIRIKKHLNDPELRHHYLAGQVQSHHELSSDHIAAYLWMWRILNDERNTNPAHRFQNADLIAAITRIDGQAPVGNGSADPAANHGQTPQSSPDYLKNPVDLRKVNQNTAQAWFEGDINADDNGLSWVNTQSIRPIDLREERLPTLALNHPLTPPFTLTMDIHVEPQSLMLIGIRQQMQAIRLGIDTRNDRMGGIITGDQGQIRSSPLPISDPRVKQTMTIVITVDEQSLVRFTLNDQPYNAPPQLFRLNQEGEMQLVFQAINTGANNRSALSLKSLHLQMPTQP